ncbi:MAG TPA: M48 family metallopeptidase [Humidesulfovibrio sp.]|uniref:M48 family metallopeptidase n=1 Tax=Humidesulfovibrio sp. TaxID=2910988 RepID=UPI002BAD5917|nr:M48 family metallopeptidase [Humidesulfovibrio sp.]HWR04247.1 M48 family metallopeptidase [Humidesulfovibrio sp.]
MTKSIPKFLCALCALALAACAPQANLPVFDTSRVGEEAKKQQELAVRDYMAKLDRMDRVGWALRSANLELCGEVVSYRLGMSYAVAEDFPKEYREALQTVLAVGDRVTVYQLTPGGPALASGIQKGDVLLAVGGKPVANKKEAQAAMDSALATGAPLQLSLERSGERREITVTPAKLCGYDMALKQNPVINAYADGKGITIFTGMMKFVQTDDELAAILGHELAHNNQGHIRAKQGNALLGALLLDLPVAILTGVNPNIGGQIGANAYSQDFESEADYVGLYFTARAGYDISNVPDLWRRMAVENPGAITMGSTHPSTSARFVGLEAAAVEIENKRKAGQPLVPEMKSAQARKDTPKVAETAQ